MENIDKLVIEVIRKENRETIWVGTGEEIRNKELILKNACTIELPPNKKYLPESILEEYLSKEKKTEKIFKLDEIYGSREFEYSSQKNKISPKGL